MNLARKVSGDEEALETVPFSIVIEGEIKVVGGEEGLRITEYTINRAKGYFEVSKDGDFRVNGLDLKDYFLHVYRESRG